MNRAIVTFTSDFGTRDYYVAAVKGAILSTNADVQIVDVSHEIAPHDILGGAFTLASSYLYFPSRTIHLVVVDPGVGSDRRAIIASTEHHLFVAPDNGVLSLVFHREEVSRVVSIESEHYFREPVSPTFHARDILGPIAGHLSRGIEITKFGPEIDDYRRLTLPPLRSRETGQIEACVLHVDKFGNVITNVSSDSLSELGLTPDMIKMSIGDHRIDTLVEFYAQGPADAPFLLVGSSGYLEIAMRKHSAAQAMNVRRGAPITIDR